MDSWGDAASTESFGRISHIFLGAVDSDPDASWSPCSCRMEKRALSMLRFAVLLALLALGQLNTTFTKSTSLAVCVMDGISAAF